MNPVFLDDVLNTVGEQEASALFPLSMKLEPFSPRPDDPDFSDENILYAAELTGTTDPALTQIRKAAAFLRENEMFRLAAVYLYRAIYTIPGATDSGAFLHFSQLDAHLAGTIRGMLRFLSAVPIVKWHRLEHIPADYSRESVKYFAMYGDNFTNAYNDLSVYTWMRQELDPDLCYIEIGRFGFINKKRDFCAIVFRHENGGFASFAVPGLYINPQGLSVSKEDREKEGGCVTSFRAENGYFTGNRIDERGRVSLTTESISASGYRLYLYKDTPALNMHIPSGGGMTPEKSIESWRAARKFYRERLGEKCPAFIACSSWICSPVMEEILPPDANLVKFVKSVHRLPNPPCASEIHPYIRQGTGLYRAMDSYINQRKKRFCSGSMFLPLDSF